MTTPMLLLTGSTGFVGTGIRNALDQTDHVTRLLVRHPNPQLANGAAYSEWLGDIAGDSSLDSAFNGISSVIHAASYVGDDQVTQQRMNIEGTRKLFEAAVRQGVANLLYISTFGVYGGSYPPGASEGDISPTPRSPLSRSRREAERIALAHGATVIRPALVYGPGDRWVIPPLVRLVVSLNAWIDEGSQRVSAIGRDVLGDLVVALIDKTPGAGVFHAARRSPIEIRQLAEPILHRLGRPTPAVSITADEGADALKEMGVGASTIQLVTSDSWINAQKIWTITGLTGPRPHELYGMDDLDAYAAQLGDLDRSTSRSRERG